MATTETTTAAPPRKSIQLFVRLLDSKTLTLHFPQSNPPTPQTLTHHLQTLTLIPPQFQTLTLNGHLISNPPNSPLPIPNSSTLTLSIRSLGGKGGFGSLLRGAVTKAGQKKTNNFDACRDMSGRRLRHVNAEKRLEEWREEEKERELERKAEEYLKKKTKKEGKGKGGGSGVEGYVEKYREESERCVREVEKSVEEAVRDGLVGRKRKVLEGLKKGKGNDGVDEKRREIWMGKRKLTDSDSDDSDDSGDSDVDVGDDGALGSEKSVVTDGGNQSDSSKGDNPRSGSFTVGKLDGECDLGGSSENGSEGEEADGKRADSDVSQGEREGSSAVDPCGESEELIKRQEEEKGCPVDTVISNPHSTEVGSGTGLETLNSKQVVAEDYGGAESEKIPQDGNTGAELPLNFDDYSSAAALEILGMEKLKSELQARGLKCGGTPQERAARLFLLKTTPIDKLPKKLLAKK
ncbi:hypothetical protein Droror1_Dr00000646 [Drosera rotundifolia]